MPPSTPRTVLSSSIRCRSCANAPVARRTFASSPASRHVGPESPRFVEVPKPPQQTADYTPVKKGSLPVPRNIFINRSESDKASEEFLSAATPEPAQAVAAKGPHAARVAWRQRLAALRRRNLRESVVLLDQRKKEIDQYLAARGAQRQAEQKRLINQPERDDERYTNPSVSKAIRDFLSGDVHRPTEADVEAKRKRVEKQEAAKALERKDQLHTLYMHARDFIVTEEQLSKVIDETFGTDDNLPGFEISNKRAGRSIWARDRPRTASEMLAREHGQSEKAIERHEGYVPVAALRLRKIAEELTGGKI